MAHTILYIEDNHDNMLLVKRVLEATGYRFLWSADGLQGISMAEAQRPDLILLDINLPGIDGYEVARRVRAHSTSLRSVPIIAITADAFRSNVELARSAGCDMYLAKPINIRELAARIRAILPHVEFGPALRQV